MNGDTPTPAETPPVQPAPPAGSTPAAPPTAPAPPAPSAAAPVPPAPVADLPETDDGLSEEELVELSEVTPVNWLGAEFVSHDKPSSWYLMVVAGAAGLALVTYLLVRDVISSLTIIVVGGMLAYIGARKPKQIPYAIDNHGIAIGSKRYGFDHFRSYALMKEGAAHSIALHPTQRFMPMVTMYYPPEQEEAIIGTLSEIMPAEEREHDYLDRFLHKIKM